MGCQYKGAVKSKTFQKTYTFWSWEKNRLFCSLCIRYLPAETVLVLVLHRELFSVALSFGPFALLPPFPSPVLGLSSQCHWTHLSLWHQGNKQSEQCRLAQRSLIFSQKFSAHPSLQSKYALHRTSEKSSQRIWKRSPPVSGLLRRMLLHSYYLPICSCSIAIFNCSGIPIPGITARLLGSRSSKEKTNKYLYLENIYLHCYFIPLDSHMLLPLVSYSNNK